MQCPRCGAENAPDVSACVRCGLPVYTQPPARPAPPPQSQPPSPANAGWGSYRQTQTMHLERYSLDDYERPGVVTAAIAACWTAALACLVYAIILLTVRRGVFADIADGASVSEDTASTSDLVNAIGFWLATGLAVVALALWLVSFAQLRHGRSLIGQVAFGIAALGAAAAIYGGLEVMAVDTVDQAGDGATGHVVMGLGYLLITAGLVLAGLSLRAEPTDVPAATAPYGGTPHHYGAPPQQGQPPTAPGAPPGYPPPGQRPPGGAGW